MADRICTAEPECGEPVFARDWCSKHWTRWRRNGDPLISKRPMYRQPPDVRFFAHVDADGDCWLWTGGMTADGYGAFDDMLAHRWIWRHLVGPIEDGCELDHLCRNRACVNPDHLEAVPSAVNKARSYSPWAIHARVTHCPRGHPYEGDNLILEPRSNGRVRRQCRECHRARGRAAYSQRVASKA